MAESLKHRTARQRTGIYVAAFTATVVLAVVGLKLLAIALRPTAIWSGLALLAVVLALTLFNARKKLPFLPLFRAAAWLRFHSYAGWFAAILFLLHVQFRVPRGSLEVLLAWLFLGVTLSGLIGLGLSRALPPRLTRHGEEVIFERIPALRQQLRARVEELLVKSVAETESSTLADFYTVRLKLFFDRPRNWWGHVLGSTRPLHTRLTGLASLDRYLNDKERAVAAALADCIRAKDNLDHHRARQGLLKGWLFVHIPLTYSLIIIAVVHGCLAWAFTRAGG